MSYQDVFDLALGLKQGNKCEEVLHDALLEVEMPLTAYHFTGAENGDFTHTMRTRSCAVAAFLCQHDNEDTTSRYFGIQWYESSPFYQELQRYKKEFLDTLTKERV